MLINMKRECTEYECHVAYFKSNGYLKKTLPGS